MSQLVRSKNQLLTALPTKAYLHILPKLERIAMVFGERLYNPGDTFTHVYFPESGVVSLLAVVDDESTLEVALVGDEGMVGLPVYLGSNVSENRAVVQGSGDALRIKAADFVKECESGNDLSRVMRTFTYSIVLQIARSAVCNRFHGIEPRLARWLLMTQDRMRSNEFRITQEFLSYMLGVRREAVSKAAAALQERRLIRYVRGNMSILDSEELRAIVCKCYRPVPASL
jgi:CRP-like cAMP-binding protein